MRMFHHSDGYYVLRGYATCKELKAKLAALEELLGKPRMIRVSGRLFTSSWKSEDIYNAKVVKIGTKNVFIDCENKIFPVDPSASRGAAASKPTGTSTQVRIRRKKTVYIVIQTWYNLNVSAHAHHVGG